MTAGRLSLIHGDALSIPLADRSVHLIVTSPPYFALRSYRDGDEHFDGQLGSEATPHHFLAALWAVMDECWRVLRDDGSAWINLGDKMVADNRGSGVDAKRGEAKWAPCGPAGYPKGGLRRKSRMLLPHRFALGLIDPEYRAFTEHRARLTPTASAPQWICRMDAVWSKLNGLPESVTDRVRASHEYWLHFTKSERYFAALDEIREESDTGDRTMYQSMRRGKGRAEFQVRGPSDLAEGVVQNNPFGKLPGSVWSVATEPLSIPDDLPQHFAAFPSEFPRRIVLGWSPSGVCVVCGQPRRPICEKDEPVRHEWAQEQQRQRATTISGGVGKVNLGVAAADRNVRITGYACACPTSDAPTTPARVLDPFSGTGTTAIVAAALGRHGVGVDLSWDYHRIARWRDRDGGLRAKVLGVERPERQLDGQASLFGPDA